MASKQFITLIKIAVYLDNCCFNRPYDNQKSLSIYLETQAKLAIQELIKDENLSLIWSFILDYENSANPDENIKNEIFLWRKYSLSIIASNEQIIVRATQFMQSGFGKKDALHLASAIDAKSKYFITVDKGILKKRKLIDDLTVCSPIEFIDYLEGKNDI